MGSASGCVPVCLFATTLGYGLAANLPQLFAAAILLLTPLAFLLSTARNCRQLSDILALVLGLALFPLASLLHTGVDILISGISAGTIAYGVHWWREPPRMSDFVGDWHALVVLVIAGFLPNEVWRMLGLWFGGGIDEGSELLVWVRAVATAILAGVIAQILVMPPGGACWPACRTGCATARWRRDLRFHGDGALDLCRRGRRRGRDAGWQMVAGLITPCLPFLKRMAPPPPRPPRAWSAVIKAQNSSLDSTPRHGCKNGTARGRTRRRSAEDEHRRALLHRPHPHPLTSREMTPRQGRHYGPVCRLEIFEPWGAGDQGR